jgi:hypothetical protein
MAKAKKSKAKKAKQSRELPLDDIRWRSAAEIGRRLFPHFGDRSLIAHIMTEAVASEKIHCMRSVAIGPADDPVRRSIDLEQQILGKALLNRSSEVMLTAQQFSVPLHRKIAETIARVRASHGIIKPQLVIDAMGEDAVEILPNGITTVEELIKGLAREAILLPNMPGHSELIPASLWTEYRFTYSNEAYQNLIVDARAEIEWHAETPARMRIRTNSNEEISVTPRPPDHKGPWILTWARKSVFFLWEPDCVKVWPALAPQAVAAREADTSELFRRKPGPRAKAEWQWFVAMKVSTLKNSDKQLPTAGELAQLCHEELGYQPAETAINKLLRELQRLLG